MAKYAVIGLGKFGMTVATTLFKNGAEVIAIDNNSNLVEEATPKVSNAYKLDCTDEIALKQLQIQEMDAVVLAIGQNIEVSILTTAILKKLGVAYIVAKADNKLHAKILEIIGVQQVMIPEEQIGLQIAHTLLSHNVVKYLDLNTGHSIVEYLSPKSFIGKSLLELALPTEKGVNVIAIRSNKHFITEDGDNKIENIINDLPGANDVIEEGDTLVLLGPTARINNLILEEGN